MKTQAIDRPRATNRRAAEDHKFGEHQPTIGIIGAGRLGTALACALAARGYTVAALVSRRASSAKRAARLIHAGTVKPQILSIENLDQLPTIDLFLITTPDDAVKAVAERLAGATGDTPRDARTKLRRPVALHTSGALTADELSSLRERGFAVGSLHPLLAVSSAESGAEDLQRGAFFCIEGDTLATRAARALVRNLDGHSFSITTRHKALYHAAAVTASGHAVALFDLAIDMLARCGLSNAQARRVLLPLLRTTLENLLAQTPARALTGTFARADAATARKHLAALRGERKSDEIITIYTLLGRRALALAKENGVDPAALKETARALDEQDDSLQRRRENPQS